jgi:uncharacterized membrane protein YqjE
MGPDVVREDTIGGLIRGILTDLKTLVREEIALARVELREQAGKARATALSFGIAAGGLFFGTAFLLIAIAMAIAELAGWPIWAGFLIVAVLLAVIGFVALSAGRRKLRTLKVAQQQTVIRLKENSEWIAKRLSSVQK